MHLASENYKITHFRHIDKGHNSMCIELIFIKIAGQMQIIINDLIVEKNADLVFITETWLKDNDTITKSNLIPPGYVQYY